MSRLGWIGSFLLLLATSGLPAQTIVEAEYLGRPHYRITTRQAVYWYDPAAGAFSAIRDGLGRDWLAYGDQEGIYPALASSSYRGLPKLMYLDEQDRLAYAGSECCDSRLVDQTTISTTSRDGQMAWQISFTPDYARLEVTKSNPDRDYWFMYAGITAGRYYPRQTYWGSNTGGPWYDRFDYYRGSLFCEPVQWMYLGALPVEGVFWLAQQADGAMAGQYSMLGDSEQGADSQDGMIIAGFGCMSSDTPTYVKPTVFYFGLYNKRITNKRQHRKLAKHISRFLKE